MRSDLAELLRDARSAVPPPRFDVEEAVAAGRRLRARRRAGWAASVTVAVVALGIGVAVSLPRAGGVTAETPGSVAPQFDYPADPMTGNIAPYQTNGVLVTGTLHVTPGYQAAQVVRPGDLGPPTGVLVVYRPGAFDPSGFGRGEAVTVAGHPGRFMPVTTLTSTGRSGPALAWQYADKAWAVVSSNNPERDLTRDELLAVAAGLRSGPARVPAVGFRLGFVPAGFTAQDAGRADEGLGSSAPGESFVRLVQGGGGYTKLQRPVIDAPVVHGDKLPTIDLNLYPSWWLAHPGTPRKSVCAETSVCSVASPDGAWVVQARGGGTVPDAQLLKVLDSVTFADPNRQTTWFPLATAVPQS
ncbi:hypothetical protein [Dactylosporangium sp. CA-092794]|uniref:hypothetical protein n=1 Tax=Dactylosporangium sp. CA-092794 TaxID=3239929 RepID=UPI003D931560